MYVYNISGGVANIFYQTESCAQIDNNQQVHVYEAQIQVPSSSNNKTLNARLLARVITGCHYTQWSSRQDFLRSLTELLTPAFINNKT
jgi:hypothetical protein